MPRSSIRIAAIAIGALVVAGCTTTAADPGVTPIATPDASHTMPDGSTMEGAEHGDHHAQEGDGSGPSAAAEMVCGGQVDTAVKLIVGAPDMPEPSTAWTAPEPADLAVLCYLQLRPEALAAAIARAAESLAPGVTMGMTGARSPSSSLWSCD